MYNLPCISPLYADCVGDHLTSVLRRTKHRKERPRQNCWSTSDGHVSIALPRAALRAQLRRN